MYNRVRNMFKEQTTMAKSIVENKKKKTLWGFIHQYRTKIVLLMFLVLVPITLVSVVYIGAYTNNKKVHFDQEVTEETVYLKEFISKDDIDGITLFIDWYELKYPVKNEEDELVGGEYTFDMYYEVKESYEILQVSVTPLLQTPWTNIRSLATQSSLNLSSRRVKVPFNYELPVSPLWFVKVTDPNLYLKVDYSFMSANNQVSKTVYVLFELENINPTRVA